MSVEVSLKFIKLLELSGDSHITRKTTFAITRIDGLFLFTTGFRNRVPSSDTIYVVGN